MSTSTREDRLRELFEQNSTRVLAYAYRHVGASSAQDVGSTSSDERVFVAVTDIVRRGYASARLRSACIEVLARLGHVRLGDETHDSQGHPVQAFEFVDPAGRPDDVRSILFDTRTAQITEEYEYFHGERFLTRTVPVLEVVDSVPAAIRERAQPQK